MEARTHGHIINSIHVQTLWCKETDHPKRVIVSKEAAVFLRFEVQNRVLPRAVPGVVTVIPSFECMIVVFV